MVWFAMHDCCVVLQLQSGAEGSCCGTTICVLANSCVMTWFKRRSMTLRPPCCPPPRVVAIGGKFVTIKSQAGEAPNGTAFAITRGPAPVRLIAHSTIC